VDPEQDVDVTARDGVLTVNAVRHRDGDERCQHSEFQYGHYARTFALPSNADEERIMAIYSHGILDITVGLANSAAAHAGKHIPVKVDHHISPT